MPTGTRCSSARSPGCGGGGGEPVVSMVMCLLPRCGRVLSVYWDDVKKTVGVLEGRISEPDLWPRLAKAYCCPPTSSAPNRSTSTQSIFILSAAGTRNKDFLSYASKISPRSCTATTLHHGLPNPNGRRHALKGTVQTPNPTLHML
jgi:hypothetical protein